MVNAFDINTTLLHKYQIKENYINFDHKTYLSLYKDLNHITTKIDAWNHYMIYGKKEKREWCNNMIKKEENNYETYENFNFYKYISIYDDIKHLKSKPKAWYHWTKYGKNENRKWCGLQNLNSLNYNSKQFFEENYTIYISRHMNNETTSKYWLYNYEHIRSIYKNIRIVIIDDNSHNKFLKKDNLYKDINFIYSENKRRGELLPFYYYFHNPKTKYAIMIHDSFFIHHEIHRIIFENDYIPLWNFKSHVYFNNLHYHIKHILSKMKNSDKIISKFENRASWVGNFGAMCIISHKRIREINEKFNFLNVMMNEINSREKRMTIERILPICNSVLNNDAYILPLFGDIHDWCKQHLNRNWGQSMTLDYYMKNKKFKENCLAVKIWTGR